MSLPLYIPVETAARELDAKLLLAQAATGRGFRVILGNRALLSNALHRHEPGIFLSHNFDRGRRRILRIARALGHRVVSWDEEGLAWVSADVYRERRVDERAVECLDAIYAWGPQHARALAPVTDAVGVPVESTGNPRADLLRPEFRGLHAERVAALRAELGEFILVNSNFGWLNYALARAGAGHDEAALDELARRSRHPRGYLEFRLAVYRAIVDVLPRLAEEFADRKIVVRPHPSENRDAWVEATRGLDNVVVRYDNDLVPWLAAAGAIVHNGCTTGVEASLLGRTSIMYRPVDGGDYEIDQPRLVSREATTPDALVTAVRESRPDDRSSEMTSRLESLVTGVTGDLCAERIARHLAALAERGPAPRSRRWQGHLRSRVRSWEKALESRSPSSPSHPDYIAQKFPPIRAAALEERLALFGAALGRAVAQVSEVSDRVFELRRCGA